MADQAVPEDLPEEQAVKALTEAFTRALLQKGNSDVLALAGAICTEAAKPKQKTADVPPGTRHIDLDD